MNASGEQVQHVADRVRMTAVRLAMTGAVLLGAASCSFESQPDDDSLAVDSTEQMITVPEQECVDPTPQEWNDTVGIFDAPETYEVASLIERYGYKNGANNIDEGLSETRAIAAERHGLTIYNYREYMQTLDDDLYSDGGPKLPFSTYLDTAKAFLALYDVDLTVDMEAEDKETIEKVDPTVLESDTVKQSMTVLIRTFGEMPVELVKYIGLKKIRLVTIEEDKVAGFVEPVGEAGEYFVDPSRAITANVFAHELYHVLDVRLCGPADMRVDDGFTDINPADIYNDRGNYISELDSIDDGLNLYTDLQLADNEAETAAVQAQIDELKSRVVTPSEYGFTSPVEDKAEVGASLFDPFAYVRFLRTSSPVLRDKSLFLLARMYHDEPKLVRYFADISHRPTS